MTPVTFASVFLRLRPIKLIDDFRASPLQRVTPLLVAATSLAVFIPFARLGVDPHHDGVMLHPALMVAEGFTIHRDVFSQYGPVTAIVQAGFVRLFGPSLWSIRFGSCILLALSNGFLFAINRRLFGPGLAFSSAAVCLLLTYFFAPAFSMLPWASDVALFLVVLSAWLILRGVEASHHAQKIALLTGAGACAGILPFVRQSVGVLLCLVLILSSIFLRRSSFEWLIAGALSGFGVVISYLLLSGSFDEFWKQAVTGPFKWAIDERGFGGLQSIRANGINFGLSGIGVLLIGVLFCNNISKIWRTHQRPTSTVFLLATTAAIFFVIVQRNGVVLQINREGCLWVFGLLGLALVPFWCFRHVTGGQRVMEIPLLTICVLASASISLFPVTDVRHAYWALLPLQGGGIYLIARGFTSGHARFLGSLALCLLLTYQTFVDVGRTLRVPRTEVENVQVLRGMFFDSEYLKFFKQRFDFIAHVRVEHPNVSILNICSDGLFASLGAIKNLPDPYFVSWSFGIDLFNAESSVGSERLRYVQRERPMVWMCPLMEDPMKIAQAYDLTLIPQAPQVPTTDQYSWWPYISYLGVPREWLAGDSEAQLEE